MDGNAFFFVCFHKRLLVFKRVTIRVSTLLSGLNSPLSVFVSSQLRGSSQEHRLHSKQKDPNQENGTFSKPLTRISQR